MIADVEKRVLRGRHQRTLLKWWHELNTWQWPAALGEPEERSKQPGGNVRREAWMQAIQAELGLRLILKRRVTV